jgi:hypothetical protein
MFKLPFGSRKDRDDGVSEVVGTLFLLVMTVAFFSIIMIWVYGFDSPEGDTYVNLYPDMERIDTLNASVSIVHKGGEPLTGSKVDIILTVQNGSYNHIFGPFTYLNGSGGNTDWKVGGQWAKAFDTVPEDANVQIRVIDRDREMVVLDTMLQRGMETGADAPPILGVPVFLPDSDLYKDGSDTFYLEAIAVDFNGDLPATGVVADLTPIWPGLGTVVLESKGYDTYRSATINVPMAAFPGRKSIQVTATDSKGYTDINYAACFVRVDTNNSANQPPNVVITSPTTSEIAAARVKKIAATYTDPDGIDLASLQFNVWEDGVPLDTTSRVANNLTVTYAPFTGFQKGSTYYVNVSIEDTTGLRGYAEMIFRVGSYGQPGNPRGETSFDVMNRNWTATTVFEHDDYIRIQVWSSIIPRIDDSEIRLTRSDSSNVYIFEDRFITNTTIPVNEDDPVYVYDATIDLAKDGTYGSKIEPGFYALKLHVFYYDNYVLYQNQIFIVIKYDDGSLPDTGGFMTFNTTGKWTSPTLQFQHNEHIYIQVVTAENLEWDKWTGSPLVHYICTINRAIVTIKEIYGDNILYADIPRYQIQYAGTGLGGHIYRLAVDLNDTIGGSTFFSSTNWYPLEVAIETQIQHIKFKRVWTTYDIAFQAGDQVQISRPCDLAIMKNDILIYHEDDTTTDQNNTLLFGETLYIYIQFWNLGEVHITNAEVEVWAISGGVTLDYWDLTSDDNFNDPNLNGMIDAAVPGSNYVWTILTWNTTRTGYDQATLEAASIRISISILTPLRGGAGSDPIIESDYSNNDVSRRLLEPADGKLRITDTGYVMRPEVDVGILDIVVDRLHFAAEDGNVHIMGINITLLGTARDTDIRRVYLVEDVNSNSLWDYDDRLACSGTFSGNVWQAPENWAIYEGQTIQYLIIYDISNAAVDSRTLGSGIIAMDDVYVEDPGTITSPTFPYLSTMSTIRSNKNELDGVGYGPAAAFRDSYLTYALALTAYNADGAKQFQGALTITQIQMDVIGWANVTQVWLLDDAAEVLASAAPAPTVSFSGLRYTVYADTGRVIYVAMSIKADTAWGEKLGIDIDRTDINLFSPNDVVVPTFGITLTTLVEYMSDYFEFKVGNPVLDPTYLDAVYGMNIGSSDSSVEIMLYGITVSWDDPDKPQWVERIYIEGQLVFEATGVTHQGNGQLLYFKEPLKLTNTDMSFRVEFNDQVIHKQWGKGDKFNDNSIYFDFHFWDDSSSNGGQYIFIKGGPSFSESWAIY